MSLEKLLPHSVTGEYTCLKDIDLYSTSKCSSLATQAAANRHLKILSADLQQRVLEVCLCEDDYPGWLKTEAAIFLEPSSSEYRLDPISRDRIEYLLPQVVDFTYRAMEVSNYYLWGGTVAPNYDCSGLMQAAFSSVGIWLPRDAYQQQLFVQAIDREELELGDLIFFSKDKNQITHVALYLGSGRYIHSSGREIGRNGIGIDELSTEGDSVTQAYYKQFHSCGRVVQSYQPTGKKWSRANSEAIASVMTTTC